MKLLIDENLSEKLVDRLADCFPESQHVRRTGLKGSRDSDIWDHAKVGGYCILTKDSDFQAKSIIEGQPPKVILCRVANCSTGNFEIVVRNSLEAIRVFDRDSDSTVLVIP